MGHTTTRLNDFTIALQHYHTTTFTGGGPHAPGADQLHYCTTSLLHYFTIALPHYCTTTLPLSQVVGHTPQERINCACGCAWRIDLGLSAAMGGAVPEALEIVGDEVHILSASQGTVPGRDRAAAAPYRRRVEQLDFF